MGDICVAGGNSGSSETWRMGQQTLAVSSLKSLVDMARLHAMACDMFEAPCYNTHLVLVFLWTASPFIAAGAFCTKAPGTCCRADFPDFYIKYG